MPLEDPIQQAGSPKRKFGEVIFASFGKIYSILFSIFEFILRSIIAILTSLAKVIRSIGIAVGIIFAAFALLVFVLFYAMDLSSSENFQNLREESFEVLSDWVEVEFYEIKDRAAIWRGDEIDSGAEDTMGIPSEEVADDVLDEEPSKFPANEDSELAE